MCIQGNPKLREGHGQLETEIDVRRLGAAESITACKCPLKFVPKGSIGLDNGLVPNRRQAIIWTNADLIHWSIYAALGGDALSPKQWWRVYISNSILGRIDYFLDTRSRITWQTFYKLNTFNIILPFVYTGKLDVYKNKKFSGMLLCIMIYNRVHSTRGH